MLKITGIFLSVLFAALDASLSTVFFCHGNQFSLFEYLPMYTFTSSVFELWCLSILRASVLLGLSFGILSNSAIAVVRLKSARSWVFYFSALLCMFTLIKLLAVSEHATFIHDKWFWCLFAWCLTGSALFAIQVILLGKIKVSQTIWNSHTVNADEGERRPLLEKDGKEKEDPGNKLEGGRKVSKGTIGRLLKFGKPDWPLFMVGFTFLTVSATGEIFIPFYTGKVVDGIVIDKSQSEFTGAIIKMALISIASAIAAGIRGFCLKMVNQKVNIRIRNKLFSSILHQDITFFDTIQTGDITSRLTSDTTTMSDAIGLNLNIFLRNLIKAGGVVFFMLKLSWRLTVVTLIGLPCILVVSEVYGKYYKELAEKVQDSLASANNVAEEACSSMKTIRSFANEEGEISRYADKLQLTFSLNKKQCFLYAGFVWCSMLFELALTVSVLYYGGGLVIRGVITSGTLISFILYQIQLGDCFNNIANVYTGLMQAAGASEKVFEYIDRKPDIVPDGTEKPFNLQGEIEFKNVSFSYPTRSSSKVLDNVSFTVKSGEVVALVGPSGGGKTTCVNLLEHFYKPSAGQVLLDKQPIQDYDHHYFHKQIALVGQEPVLYARSIKENICYGLNEDEWDTNSVETAARMANAHTFITDLKEGYKTQTGEKGVQMSGGQKQRIAIARALLREPKVLLLDEATSALDSESEHLVQQALYESMKGRSVIVIAHRLSTVEKADKIIVIDKGQVVEQGTHQQLLQMKGMYSSLVKRQLLLSESSWSDASRSMSGQSDLPCHSNRKSSHISIKPYMNTMFENLAFRAGSV